MLKRFVRIFGGDPNKRAIDKSTEIVDLINSLEAQFEALSDDELHAKTPEFRQRLAEGETLDDLLPEAYAAVREASKRAIGLRHYDVQLIGGIALHQGRIAEMRTGEGKTLVATLPLYLNALTGKGTHLITVNDYLARRDARWMAPIYHYLDLNVGVLQMASRTENGKKAFLIDLERESPHEDQHQLRIVPRLDAYAADITYGTNSEFGFDYLRDNMTMRLEDRVQRAGKDDATPGLYYAIVDEVDNVLIDEARTPLIISGPAQDEAEWYLRMAQAVRQLRPEDYEINEKDRNVTLTEIGEIHVEEILGMALRDPERPEDVTPEQARTLGYLEQALRAQHLFRRNKDYLVQAGKVVIVDEFTGRLMPGRRWSDGLHQAVEAKENVRVQAENVTYATITIQNYFRMYEKLSGMSGTASTEAEEFDKIYKLDVVTIPTNLEYQALRADAALMDVETRDEQGYKYSYYAHRDDPSKAPIFWRRKDYPDIVYRTAETKLRAVTREILRYHVQGRPLLVGTTSVELSERVSGRLKAEPLRRLCQTMILRQVWYDKNKREEDGRAIPELQFLNEPLDQLDISNMRRLARDLEVSFNPEDASNTHTLSAQLELDPADSVRLNAALQGGIPHQVLNARKHTEESQIIAGAGSFGAVTIATNMAGRGVDIKLGGELPEEVISGVNRILRRVGYADPFDMTMEERHQALLKLKEEDYGIYEEKILLFLNYMEGMERVRSLGGLHVIGSERHEARRIDNQLRGRSARQGDPGSSRFYLSMEDELMRLFGGQQADNLMQRMKIDDALPLEMGLVSRIVEQSQTRVEGANFDMRKHLLEYDDVLNTQRGKIYGQRNRIFVKEDLSEDVTEMLRAEVNRRVPVALEDPDGPWKLLAWLEQIQPTLQFGAQVFPSFMLSLLLDELLQDQTSGIPVDAAIGHLIAVAQEALLSEEKHHQLAVQLLLQQAQEKLESQVNEGQDAVDTFFEGLELEDETEQRSPRQVIEELSALLRLPVRLSPEQQRFIKEDPRQVKSIVFDQVQTALYAQAASRLVGSIERRLEEPLGLDVNELAEQDWDTVSDRVIAATQALYDGRRSRLLGEGGQIGRDLENALSRADGQIGSNALLQLLLHMPQGARAAYDKKTHRRVFQRTTRFTYVFYAARLLEGREPGEITEAVLEHLERAQNVIRQVLGAGEWNRLANLSMQELDEIAQNGLREALGEEAYLQSCHLPIQSLTQDETVQIINELGRQALTKIYRQLLLGVITELWVDYLTQMEALRVSIGLEAYGQRDPLVQYKNRAFALFQELLDNMRSGVVTRMFTYRPRDPGAVQTAVTRPEEPESETVGSGNGPKTLPEPQTEEPAERNKKRRRRRH